jgi:hypothetical protein
MRLHKPRGSAEKMTALLEGFEEAGGLSLRFKAAGVMKRYNLRAGSNIRILERPCIHRGVKL